LWSADVLQEALKDADANVRWAAALALIRIDPMAARPAVPMFVEGLKSGQEKVYWDARWFLTMMGPAAKAANQASNSPPSSLFLIRRVL
jgi:HEAT repeat protein